MRKKIAYAIIKKGKIVDKGFGYEYLIYKKKKDAREWLTEKGEEVIKVDITDHFNTNIENEKFI